MVADNGEVCCSISVEVRHAHRHRSIAELVSRPCGESPVAIAQKHRHRVRAGLGYSQIQVPIAVEVARGYEVRENWLQVHLRRVEKNRRRRAVDRDGSECRQC